MKIWAAIFFSLVLMQCEWKDSIITSVLKAQSEGAMCCKTVCTPTRDPESNSSDCEDVPVNDCKQCCKSCFYFLALVPGITVYYDFRELFDTSTTEKISGFQADCFHPPEFDIV